MKTKFNSDKLTQYHALAKTADGKSSLQADELLIAAKKKRVGFLIGIMQVPADFDVMGFRQIRADFDGLPPYSS